MPIPLFRFDPLEADKVEREASVPGTELFPLVTEPEAAGSGDGMLWLPAGVPSSIGSKSRVPTRSCLTCHPSNRLERYAG